MPAAVLTPFTRTAAVELGNRQWVKKILPVGDVEYKGRMLRFTRDYLARLKAAFDDRAYDQVPFQLADAANTHTNDPERTRGEITGMDLRDDGLYVTAQVTPDGEAVLTANPRLGVSARIVEDYARSDGRHFPAAVQHVLGTLDPRIPGLGAWQAIEAANGTDQVIDLSALHFTGEDSGMPEMTEAQRGRLARLLDLPDDQLDAITGGMVLTPDEMAILAGPDDEDEDGGDELSDAELDALVAAAAEMDEAGLLDDIETEVEGEPVAAGLSSEAQFAIDLANARAEEASREVSVITARLAEQDFLAERDRMAHSHGIPPYITDLARPVLEGSGHTIDLANGKLADVGQIVRKVMIEMARVAELGGLLGAELGSPMDEPEGVRAGQAEAGRDDTVNRAKAQMFGILR